MSLTFLTDKDEVLRYSEQNLTEEQKAQARENIGVGEGGGSGITVTAKPGQLIRVKEVDENGNPTAWEAVPWGYTEGGMVEILPEITITEENVNEQLAKIPPLGFVVGNTYVVAVNGVEYSCVADAGEIIEGVPATFLASDDMPIVIVELPPEIAAEFGVNVVMESTGNAEFPCTISIYADGEVVHPLDPKYLPEGVPYCVSGGMVEIYPESQIAYGEDMAYVLSYDAQLIEVGKTYIINWNGVEYTCVGQDASSIVPGMVFAGNGALAGFSGNDEPFIIGCVEGITFAEAIDGSTEEITVSIKGESVNIRKLDPRCLPDDVGGGVELYDVDFELTILNSVFSATTTKTFDEVYAKAIAKNTIVRGVAYAGENKSMIPLATCSPDAMIFTYVSYGGSTAGIISIILSSDGNCTVHVKNI